MDKRLKQRLLGAAVIIALAVIFVPELVKQAPSPDPLGVSAEIPPQPAALAAISPRTVQLPSEALAAQNEAAAAAEAAQTQPVDDSSAQADEFIPPLPAVVAEIPDTSGSEEQQRRQSAAAEEREKEAQKLKQQQERRRIERQRADQAARRLAEIEAEKKEAAAQKQIAKAPVVQAEKNQKPPSLPKLQLISPSLYQGQKTAKNTPSRWIVQAGSFADSQNAKLLRERLRTLQFQVSLNQATVDGETRYRVQLGPHVSRAESERIRDRLLREAGIPSNVVPIYN